jgi:hypothetical protein
MNSTVCNAQDIIALLGDADAPVRAAAIEAVLRLGPAERVAAVDRATALLGDADHAVRLAAMSVMSSVDPARICHLSAQIASCVAAPPAAETPGSDCAALRAVGLDLLARIWAEQAGALHLWQTRAVCRGSSAPSAQLAAQAAHMCLNAALSCIGDADAAVRRHAFLALRSIPPHVLEPAHLDRILPRLTDSDPTVRRLCTELLSTLRSSNAGATAPGPGADVGGRAPPLTPEQLAGVDMALRDSHYRRAASVGAETFDRRTFRPPWPAELPLVALPRRPSPRGRADARWRIDAHRAGALPRATIGHEAWSRLRLTVGAARAFRQSPARAPVPPPSLPMDTPPPPPVLSGAAHIAEEESGAVAGSASDTAGTARSEVTGPAAADEEAHSGQRRSREQADVAEELRASVGRSGRGLKPEAVRTPPAEPHSAEERIIAEHRQARARSALLRLDAQRPIPHRGTFYPQVLERMMADVNMTWLGRTFLREHMHHAALGPLREPREVSPKAHAKRDARALLLAPALTPAKLE